MELFRTHYYSRQMDNENVMAEQKKHMSYGELRNCKQDYLQMKQIFYLAPNTLNIWI